MSAGIAGKGHSRQQSERLRCIVMESGCQPFSEQNCEGFDETVTLVQTPEESAAAFAQRILARIAKAERGGRHFACIKVLTSAESSSAVRAARRLVVLGLSAHARARGQAELLLSSPPRATASERSHLLELLAEVTASPGCLAARLSFGEPRELPTRKSGVFPRAERRAS